MQTVELHIEGPDPRQRLRYEIHEGETIRFGRATRQGCDVPWDLAISREHADAKLDGGRLIIRMLSTARNPILCDDQFVREVTLDAGDQFCIGATTFHVDAPLGEASSPSTADTTDYEDLLSERSFAEGELEAAEFGCAERQLEALARLPRLIAESRTDEGLAAVLARLLLDALPHAVAVAVTDYDVAQLPSADQSTDDFPAPRMARIETRDTYRSRFRPSRRLLARALSTQTSVLQFWGEEATSNEFTFTEGLAWAFAAPVRGESCQGWAMYVAGRGGRSGAYMVDEEALRGDLRFTELVAQFIGSIRQVRMLQQHKTQLSTFLSPSVIESLMSDNYASVMEPSVSDITVLFCDLRGFSRQSEERRDELLMLLESVRTALGLMAEGILNYDGAIADFQGDAVLGFWGWPVRLDEGPLPACRAALDILQHFSGERTGRDRLLQNVSVGIGVAHGRAVAGEIGTLQQAKVGVFGPVVNQGARLEGMTKQFGVPICVDESTADYLSKRQVLIDARLRRLARVYPAGMTTAMTVYALLPPAEDGHAIDSQLLEAHDEAVRQLIDGNWSAAAAILKPFPANDGPSQFLLQFFEKQGLQPPSDWDGAIRLNTK